LTVATLPFHPIGVFKNLTHNDLSGDDYSECSVAFLYLLTLLTLRNSIRKMIGFRRPRTREPMTITFPVRLLFQKDAKWDKWWGSLFLNSFFMAGFYGYTFYRIMRKHQSIKHKVLTFLFEMTEALILSLYR
jgi:Integral membrane protein EMC3/TMCO1-like